MLPYVTNAQIHVKVQEAMDEELAADIENDFCPSNSGMVRTVSAITTEFALHGMMGLHYA